MPIGIDCDFLNTVRLISHATLSWCWLEPRSLKKMYYKVLQSTGPYYSLPQSTTSVLFRTTTVLLQYYSVLQSTKYYKELPQ